MRAERGVLREALGRWLDRRTRGGRPQGKHHRVPLAIEAPKTAPEEPAGDPAASVRLAADGDGPSPWRLGRWVL